MADSKVKNQKYERTTQAQLKYFIEFCIKHPELNAGKNRATKPKLLQNLWKELADTLNAMRGATRTPVEWKKALNNWRHTIRSRARKVNASQIATDGGPPEKGLSEKGLGSFVMKDVDGHAALNEMGFEEEEEMPTTSTAAAASMPVNPGSNFVIYADNSAKNSVATPLPSSSADSSRSSENIFVSTPSSESVASRERITTEQMFIEIQRAMAKREEAESERFRQQMEVSVALVSAINNLTKLIEKKLK